MSAATITLRGRRAAEALMVDACVVRHITGLGSDPDTGVTTPTTAILYTGKCKVQRAAAGGSPTDVGEAERMASELQVHVPISVTGARPDDTITITASALDPDLVGRVFTIRGLPDKTYLTARRYSVQELTS